MLGLQNEREWQAFCAQVLRRPELATDVRFASNTQRTAARDELHGLIVEVFAALTADEIVARLDGAQIANARVNTMADVWEHPQLRARGRWREVGSNVGPLPALLPPGVPEDWTPRMDAVPALGQHTGAILDEPGYDAAAVAALRGQAMV